MTRNKHQVNQVREANQAPVLVVQITGNLILLHELLLDLLLMEVVLDDSVEVSQGDESHSQTNGQSQQVPPLPPLNVEQELIEGALEVGHQIQ